MLISSKLVGQTVVTNPNMDRQNDSNSIINITKIEKYSDKTVVYFLYKNTNYGWINIDPNTFMKETGGTKKYTLIQAIGIDVAPNQTDLRGGQEVAFKLVFPAIPNNITKIDIIECEKSSCFNFYGIQLKNGENKILDAPKKMNISTTHLKVAKRNEKTEKYDLVNEEDEVTFFEFNKRFTMFKHTTPSSTSTYIIKSSEYDKEKSQWDFEIVSDAGNKYFMLLDLKNSSIVLFFERDGESYLALRKIKKLWFEE